MRKYVFEQEKLVCVIEGGHTFRVGGFHVVGGSLALLTEIRVYKKYVYLIFLKTGVPQRSLIKIVTTTDRVIFSCCLRGLSEEFSDKVKSLTKKEILERMLSKEHYIYTRYLCKVPWITDY